MMENTQCLAASLDSFAPHSLSKIVREELKKLIGKGQPRTTKQPKIALYHLQLSLSKRQVSQNSTGFKKIKRSV